MLPIPLPSTQIVRDYFQEVRSTPITDAQIKSFLRTIVSSDCEYDTNTVSLYLELDLINTLSSAFLEEYRQEITKRLASTS